MGCHEAKGTTGIMDVSKAEEPGDQGHRMIKRQCFQDSGLGDLVQNNNRTGNPYEFYIFALIKFNK